MRTGAPVELSDGRRGEILGGPVPRFSSTEPILYIVKVPGSFLPLTIPRDELRTLAGSLAGAR